MNTAKHLKITLTLILLSFVPFSYGQELEYEFLFELKASLDAPIRVGKTALGTRTIYPVKSGTIEGPQIKGEILPNGGDWLLTLDSVTSKLDVRGVIKTDKEDIIYISYTGYIHKNPDGTYYFRSNPIFETGSKAYYWLNYTVAIGVGRFTDDGVAYRIYAIK